MTLRGRLAHGSLWVFLAQVVIQGMAVLVTVILARYLGDTPEASAALLGKYFIVSSLLTLLAPLAALGLSVAVPKFLAEFRVTDPGRTARVAASATTITLASATALSALFFLLAEFLANGIYADPDLALLLRVSAPAVAFTAFAQLALGVLQGFHRMREYSLVAMAFSVLSVPVTWLLVVNHAAFGLATGLVGATVAMTVNLGLNAAGVLWLARRGMARAPRRWDASEARPLLGLSLPAFFSILILRPALLFQASAIFLVYGAQITGVWKIASAFYRTILFLPAALAVPLLPAMSELYVTGRPAERREKVTKIFRIAMAVVLPACLLAALGAVYFIEFLFGPTYLTNDSIHASALLAAAAFFDSVSLVVLSLLQGTGRTRLVLALDAVQAATLVTLTQLLVTPAFLLVGAAAVTLVNAGLLVALSVGYLGRRGEVDLRGVSDLFGLGVAGFGISGLLLVALLGTPYYLPAAAGTLALLFGVGYRLLSREDREILWKSFAAFREGNREGAVAREAEDASD